MKRLLIAALAVLTVFSFAACKNETAPTDRTKYCPNLPEAKYENADFSLEDTFYTSIGGLDYYIYKGVVLAFMHDDNLDPETEQVPIQANKLIIEAERVGETDFATMDGYRTRDGIYNPNAFCSRQALHIVKSQNMLSDKAEPEYSDLYAGTTIIQRVAPASYDKKNAKFSDSVFIKTYIGYGGELKKNYDYVWNEINLISSLAAMGNWKIIDERDVPKMPENLYFKIFY